MKVLSASVKNFASYKELDFQFDEQGLSLISGSTGAGKSTLCDIVPWILFGRTSKDGAVDEVLSWPGDSLTSGEVILDNGISIYRSRGAKSGDNDLLIINDDGDITRGKDLTDTQILINKMLGMDINLYLSGAYFHEFSQTAQFFTTTAKNRRQLTEQLVDLKLAKDLTKQLSEYKKEVKEEKQRIGLKITSKSEKLEYISDALKFEIDKSNKWISSVETKLMKLNQAKDEFKNKQNKAYEKELTKFYEKQIELETLLKELESEIVQDSEIQAKKDAIEISRAKLAKIVCQACGNIKSHGNELLLIKEEYNIKQLESLNQQKKVVYKTTYKNLQAHLQNEPVRSKVDENPYVMQIEELKGTTNPHIGSIETLHKDNKEEVKALELLKIELSDFNVEFEDTELLLQIVEDFRGVLIKNAVLDLETNTNKIIETHFDAEIRVKFDVSEADKLEVAIYKDGNSCVYTQLSKGQRQLLKLAFSVSVMKAVGNHHGLNFNAVFLDEALDGLDETIKVKAFGLLQELSQAYSSVFVVEHSNELKSLFEKKFEVSLENGNSVIGET